MSGILIVINPALCSLRGKYFRMLAGAVVDHTVWTGIGGSARVSADCTDSCRTGTQISSNPTERTVMKPLGRFSFHRGGGRREIERHRGREEERECVSESESEPHILILAMGEWPFVVLIGRRWPWGCRGCVSGWDERCGMKHPLWECSAVGYRLQRAAPTQSCPFHAIKLSKSRTLPYLMTPPHNRLQSQRQRDRKSVV